VSAVPSSPDWITNALRPAVRAKSNMGLRNRRRTRASREIAPLRSRECWIGALIACDGSSPQQEARFAARCSGQSIIQLVTPPPLPTFFRIMRLRTFSWQPIEPKRRTSNCLICSGLQGEELLPCRGPRRVGRGRCPSVCDGRCGLTSWQAATGDCFSKSFSRPAHWVQPPKTRKLRPRVQWYSARLTIGKCAGHPCE